jgi:hypothetical protein
MVAIKAINKYYLNYAILPLPIDKVRMPNANLHKKNLPEQKCNKECEDHIEITLVKKEHSFFKGDEKIPFCHSILSSSLMKQTREPSFQMYNFYHEIKMEK